MTRSTIIALISGIVAACILSACSKAPSGVIPEDDMAHVLADFALAEAYMDQHPRTFETDSAKLALKQSILKKYDADLAMLDSSYAWYGHNLKLYAEVHDEAVKIIEKQAGIKSDIKDGSKPGVAPPSVQGLPSLAEGKVKRDFATTGDSANVWKEPQHWILTSAMQQGYITFDYKPDKQHQPGDLYTLHFKLLNTGSTVRVMLAIDYQDGTMTCISRTAHVNGWSNFPLQADSSRTVKRIYGFIGYDIKPLGVAFIDSIYMLRTHLDRTKYGMISVQKFIAPKAVIDKMSQESGSNQLPPAQAGNTPRQQAQGMPGQQPALKPTEGRAKPAAVPPRQRPANQPRVGRAPIR